MSNLECNVGVRFTTGGPKTNMQVCTLYSRWSLIKEVLHFFVYSQSTNPSNSSPRSFMHCFHSACMLPYYLLLLSDTHIEQILDCPSKQASGRTCSMHVEHTQIDVSSFLDAIRNGVDAHVLQNTCTAARTDFSVVSLLR